MIVMSPSDARDRAARSEAILSYWFASLDDGARLDRTIEPFRTCYGRWYGKDDATDREIRALFEADLHAVTASGLDFRGELDAWARAPLGLLALVILLDQLPRNMYRGTRRMYAQDELALATAMHAIRAYEGHAMPLVHRMFLYVPLMHSEDVAVQREMVRRFESLAELAGARGAGLGAFFEHALGFARKHLDVVERYGRFPHRNAILGRRSSAGELEYLQQPGAGF